MLCSYEISWQFPPSYGFEHWTRNPELTLDGAGSREAVLALEGGRVDTACLSLRNP